MDKSVNKKPLGLFIYFSIITFILSFVTGIMMRLEREGNIVYSFDFILKVFLAAAGIAVTVGVLSYFAFKNKLAGESAPVALYKGKLPLIVNLSWPIIALMWVPGILAYYPGICGYDFQPQIYQIVYSGYNDHHPLMHTMLIKWFWRLGQTVFNSNNAGFAVLCFVQVIFVSWAFSYFIKCVYRIWPKKWLSILLTVFTGLYPFNIYLSISITKDIPFSAGFLTVFVSIMMIIKFTGNSFKLTGHDVLLFIGGLFVMLFRNNGPYAFFALILTAAVFAVFCKGRRKTYLRVLINTAVSFAIGIVVLKCLSTGLNAEGVDKREMLSLPAQQIARTVKYHEAEIDFETMDEILRMIWPESLYSYRPDISDPVKANVISWEFMHRPKLCLDVYTKLLKRYPGDYVNAFLSMYAGFLNPFDKTHLTINDKGEGVPDGLHYIQTVFYYEDMGKFDITTTPVKWLNNIYEAYANNDGYMKIPVLNLLFVPGVFLWAFLYSIGYMFYRKRYEVILPLMLAAAYMATLFLGPTVQLRYIYPVMLCLIPLWLMGGKVSEE